MVLIFDDINVCGELAFKIVNGEYHFFGLVDEDERSRLFGARPAGAMSERMQAQVASHALVFQVTTPGSTDFRRVCGIHAVRSLNAEKLHRHFWETVSDLALYTDITIVAAVCDGAGSNRLFMKMNTSNLKRGSKNTFVKVRCGSLSLQLI